ncbi:MAG: efflux RND transporter periplasmic adaptor subunit [Thermodesulfobacteriota bacterium]
MSRKKTVILNLVASVLILGAGFGIMVYLVKNRVIPEKKEIKEQGVLVDTVKLKKSGHLVKISLTGIVNIFEKAEISPEVSGRIIHVNDKLEKGGYIKKGEILFKIDSFNYKRVIESSKSAVARAESELKQLISKSESAKTEWKRFNPDKKPQNQLVYLSPQLKAARASLNAAKADLEKAEKDLEKTVVYSPFNSFVLSERVSKGVFASQTNPLVTLIPSDKRDIILPVPVSDLAHITDENGDFINKEVKLSIPETDFKFQGSLVRILPDVDPGVKMYRLLVRIENLYEKYKKSSFLLADQSFVKAEIKGRKIDNSFKIPSEALRGSGIVWIIRDDKRLGIRDVELIRHGNEKSVIKAEFKDGTELITTPVNGAVEGMLLRKKKGE